MYNKNVLLVVSFIVLGFFIFIALGSGSDEEVTPSPSDSSSSTDTADTSEPEEAATGNSRSNPAGLNETFVVSKDDWLVGQVEYEVELVEVISGDDAWSIVRNANQFNDAPEDGKEYILAKFRVKVVSTEEDEPYDLNHAMFSVISGSGVEYADFISVAGLDPNLRADLYEGGEQIGWTYFIVDVDDENPLAVMDRTLSSEIWFKLRD